MVGRWVESFHAYVYVHIIYDIWGLCNYSRWYALSDEDTQPVLATVVYAIICFFAIIGFCVSVGFCNDVLKNSMLQNEHSITKNITIIDVSYDITNTYIVGFEDNSGDWYFDNNGFPELYEQDPIYVNHNYTITYYCDTIHGNRRTLLKLVDLEEKTDKYACKVVNGVCQ